MTHRDDTAGGPSMPFDTVDDVTGRTHAYRYPAEPILSALGLMPVAGVSDEETNATIALRLRMTPSGVAFARERGFTWPTADRYACMLNLHPAILWPDVWAAHAAYDVEHPPSCTCDEPAEDPEDPITCDRCGGRMPDGVQLSMLAFA